MQDPKAKKKKGKKKSVVSFLMKQHLKLYATYIYNTQYPIQVV